MHKQQPQDFTLADVTVEICCGAAGLSSALRRLGFKVYPIDHSSNRHSPKVKAVILDVANSQHLTILVSLLEACRPCHVHMGLPCGTCSRAREKPLPKHLQHRRAPQPLRSEQHLEGLPSLTGSDLLKVQMANSLYKAAVVILEICRRLGCCITIENPLRSWLWMLLAHYVQLTGNQALIEWYANLECVMFDACAHGSDRDKRTKLLATPDVFSELEQYCPGDHQHASWAPYQHNGKLCFPTASEAESPTILCDRIAACVLKFALSRNIVVSQAPKLKDLMKLQLGQQSIKHPPLIPEFKDFVFLEKPSDESHLKLLAAPYNQGQQQLEQPQSLQETTTRPTGRLLYKYGVWHSPAEFLEKAQQVRHPVDADNFLHEATKAAIDKVINTDVTSLAKQRLAAVFNLRRLHSEMASEEVTIRPGMHQHVSSCTRPKSVALFSKILSQLDYWDMGVVVDLLRDGVPLVGLQEAPIGYKKNFIPATMTEEELLSSALYRRKLLMGDHRDWTAEEQQALLDTTSDEVTRGFLEGPYSEDEMTVLLETDQWSLNPRFVLFQGASRKVRIIDDAKKSCVNDAYSSTVKLQLQDVDYVASMVVELARAASATGRPAELMGKTFDLSKAYKQLAVLPEHRKHSVVGFPIKGKWQFYRSLSLPFGCTGSVYGFVRISQAIWYIITRLLHCVCAHYFDDFPVVENSAGCRVLSSAVSAVLDILGWTHAKEGDKTFPFSSVFDVLGVTVDLKPIPEGAFVISNKPSRIEKLGKMIATIRSQGFITYAQASELQGLLNFAVGYFSGKSLKHLVSAFVPMVGERTPSGAQLLKSLCDYSQFMINNLPPRRHEVHGNTKPVIIFTDGAWEQGRASAGAVVVDGDDRFAFTIEVPQRLVSHWLDKAGEQIISQTELWALVLVKWTFKDHCTGRRIVAWIDNEAARACTIKASSPSPTMRALARVIGDLEVSFPSMTWYERLGSKALCLPLFSGPASALRASVLP